MGKKILVIGGGISGIETALELVQRGFEVYLIEASPKLGGAFNYLGSVYGLAKEPKSFLENKLKNLKEKHQVHIYTECTLEDLDGMVGEFTAYLKKGEEAFVLKLDAIVVAIGFQAVFCPVKYGLGISERVIGQLKLQQLLLQNQIKWKTVSFVVGKSTENYLTQSITALNCAVFLLKRLGITVNFFYRNIKVSGDGLEDLYREARNLGINFFKYKEDIEISISRQNLYINYSDPFLKETMQGEFKIFTDAVILPEELLPTNEVSRLKEILKINVDQDHFLGSTNVHLLPIQTNREGIYLAGSCHATATLKEVLLDANLIAGDLRQKLSSHFIEGLPKEPQVEATKCAVCLTCYRACPHFAIKIVQDDKVDNLYHSVAEINPLACRRCGICTSMCPGKAIQLPGYEDQSILDQLMVMEG